MAEVTFQAGMKFDLPNKQEIKQAYTDAVVELYRGVRFVTRPAQGTVTNPGALVTITAKDFGPEGGFTWGVNMLSVFGLSANQSLSVFVNEASQTRFVGLVTTAAPTLLFPRPGLVLNPEERVILTGNTLTPDAVLTAVMRATELPESMRWQLI